MTTYPLELDLRDDPTTLPAHRAPPSDWVWAVVFSGLVMSWALLFPAMQKWIAIPFFTCGVLSSLDAIAWLRRRTDLFDPVGVIGVLSVHFFFLAPILHVVWNAWSAYVTPLEDWSEWLGWMAVINTAGLLIYRFFRTLPLRRYPTLFALRAPASGAGLLLFVAMIITAAAQIAVYAQFGGIGGYIDAFERLKSKFLGWGWVFMISESFPILFMIAFAVHYLKKGVQPSWVTVVIVLLVFFALKLLFGGLRGSRSNTIWGVFWAVGIVHLLVRRIPRWVVVTGLAFMLLFMYVYGFYKAGGLAGLEAALNPSSRAHLQRDTGRTFNAVLLGDLARADIQAYLLRQTCSPRSNYKWAYGRTYLGTAALLIPRALWADRPDYKVQYGTNALFGEGFVGQASNVYGIAGEGMLNFGPVAAVLSFAVFGYLVGLLRRWMLQLPPLDMRWILAPFGIYLCVAVLVGDSDNVLYALIKEGAMPLLVVYAGSRALDSGGNSAEGYGDGAY